MGLPAVPSTSRNPLDHLNRPPRVARSSRPWAEGRCPVGATHDFAANRTNPAVDTAASEREIDERVYRLYGLTADEIKLVEESAK